MSVPVFPPLTRLTRPLCTSGHRQRDGRAPHHRHPLHTDVPRARDLHRGLRRVARPDVHEVAAVGQARDVEREGSGLECCDGRDLGAGCVLSAVECLQRC